MAVIKRTREKGREGETEGERGSTRESGRGWEGRERREKERGTVHTFQ